MQNGQQPAKRTHGKTLPTRYDPINPVTIQQGNTMKIIIGHDVDYTTVYSRTDLPPVILRK